jgi:hypothetical protein
MNYNKQQLEQKVNKLVKTMGTIQLEGMLAGGVVSDIYSAILKDSSGEISEVVIKYTKEDIPLGKIFSKQDYTNSFSLAQETHDLDVQISEELNILTPTIIRHYKEEKITLMKNFGDDGFELLQNRLLNKNLPSDSAQGLGKTLAQVRIDLEKIGKEFTQIEKSSEQFMERFLELRVLLYNGRMDIFNQIEEDFMATGQKGIIWTDGDQKNFAIDANGKAMAFDFGRSIICDPDFMLPNLLGHLGLFFIAGYLEDGINFLKSCQQSFKTKYKKINSSYELDEQKFVNYFTTSLLHRGMAMRWIDPKIANNIGEDSLKYASMHFGDIIFDKKSRVSSIDRMYQILQKVAEYARDGKYKRTKLDL